MSAGVKMKCTDEQHISEGRGDDTGPTQNQFLVSQPLRNFDFHSPAAYYITRAGSTAI